MSRPPLREAKKRKGVSISLRQDILSLADGTDNESKFFEQSVEACQGIKEVMKELRGKKLKASDALEEIEDIIDAWDAQFDEKIPYSGASPTKKESRKTGS